MKHQHKPRSSERLKAKHISYEESFEDYLSDSDEDEGFFLN